MRLASSFRPSKPLKISAGSKQNREYAGQNREGFCAKILWVSYDYCGEPFPKIVLCSNNIQNFPLADLLSWFQRAIERTTSEVPAYCHRLNQEMNMSALKLPKPDLPIHLQQALLLAASVLTRLINEKQAQKDTEA